MRPLRVLHVIPSVSPRDGGPSRAMWSIERALSDAGAQVTTLTTDHDLELRDRSSPPPADSGACRIYARKWLTPYKVAPGLVPHLMRAVARHDVVHIHALFSFASTAAAWVALRKRVPYVVRPLGTLSGYGLRARRPRLKVLSIALIERQILQHAAAVHFTSANELAEVTALGLPMRGVVIPLGIDAERGGPVGPMTHEALSGRRAILFLSRLDPKKNVEALIDAVALSPMLRNSCALLIAGAGEPGYVASLKARSAAAGIDDHTVWLGHVEGERKRAALAAAQVFVLPSVSENFGIAAIEALLAGVPTVLGTGVAIAAAVASAGGGQAVPPDPPAIASALECLLGNEERRAAMAANAAEFARREYSARTMALPLLALYRDIRNRGSDASPA